MDDNPCLQRCLQSVAKCAITDVTCVSLAAMPALLRGCHAEAPAILQTRVWEFRVASIARSSMAGSKAERCLAEAGMTGG